MAVTARYKAQIVVLVKPEVRERFVHLAEEREESVSSLIRRAIDEGLKIVDPMGETIKGKGTTDTA